jgi:hypothetical protein
MEGGIAAHGILDADGPFPDASMIEKTQNTGSRIAGTWDEAADSAFWTHSCDSTRVS